MREINFEKDNFYIYKNYLLLEGDEIKVRTQTNGIIQGIVEIVYLHNTGGDEKRIYLTNQTLDYKKEIIDKESSTLPIDFYYNIGIFDEGLLSDDYKIEDDIYEYNIIKKKRTKDTKLIYAYNIYKRKLIIFKDKCNIVDKQIFTINKESQHPDCCGVRIFYNFFNVHHNIKIFDYIEIYKKIISNKKTPKLCHLSNEQEEARKFVKEVGFKELYTYSNPNSQNDITLFQFEPEIN